MLKISQVIIWNQPAICTQMNKKTFQNLQQQKNFILKNTINIRKLSSHLFRTKGIKCSCCYQKIGKSYGCHWFWRITITDDSNISWNMQMHSDCVKMQDTTWVPPNCKIGAWTKLLYRPSQHKNCHPIEVVFHTWHILSRKDLHGAQTTDLGLFSSSWD